MTTYCSLKENLPDLSIIHLIKPIPGDSTVFYLYCIVVKPSNFSEYSRYRAYHGVQENKNNQIIWLKKTEK